MTPHQFIAKWQRADLSERSACQQHFLDLCDLLDQPKPAEADPDGAFYTFERGVHKTAGGHGWADVWMRGHFGWEYKRRHKDLAAAYKQLLDFREDLENPPLLVVCDLDRFEVHTNFTNTPKRIYAFDLDGLAQPPNLDVLRKLFTEPESLRPDIRAEAITRDAAERFGDLAKRLRMRKGVSAQRAAHFLMKLMFCMFGERIGLLPSKLFGRLLETAKANPAMLTRKLQNLFRAMAEGGDFGAETIPRFNGGLFADDDAVPLTEPEINILASLNAYDWSNVEPSIFGTLFERHFDPGKESLIGAHYTSREDVVTLIEPVVMAPLRREWAEVRHHCDEELWPKVQAAARAAGKANGRGSKARKAFDRALQEFAERLHHVTVLDPACGSGNFLYVAINLLLDLEKEVIAYAASHGLTLLPHVRPTQLAGLEINPFAQQLAQAVIWIGYLQWMHHNGFKLPNDPVLEPIESIRCQDAILDLSDGEHPKEPDWPAAEFIVGNPPFLGNRLMGSHFNQAYISGLSHVYEARMGGRPDLCCYWFERARREIERRRCKRAGLLATQGIRGGTNRNVLKRIKETGDIFFAESDRDWVLDGANVHISMVGFDDGTQRTRTLDSREVPIVHANLTAAADVVTARPLPVNKGLSFQGSIKRGPFDVCEDAALTMINERGNPNGRPNSDVVVPYVNGLDVTRRNRNVWILDFGENQSIDEASLYSAPFEYLRSNVYPERQKANQANARDKWWLHWCARPQMKVALAGLRRFIATPRVAKHRLFVWLESPSYPDCQLIVVPRDDDYFFGILHSRIHEVWARAQGTQVRERESGFRYTPTSCFETFAFPDPSPAQAAAVSGAARRLDELRAKWLNPPEWTRTEVLQFVGSSDGPWRRFVQEADASGIGMVRWPRIVPKDESCAESLRKRTLTNLYNQRPAWLEVAHKNLDDAVLAAYGWGDSIGDEELLRHLLVLSNEQGHAAKTEPRTASVEATIS